MTDVSHRRRCHISMVSPVRQLLALITQSVETLEAACQSSGTTIPDLHTAFAPPSEDFRANPEAAEAARIIAAAALQLEAIVTPPQVSLYRIFTGVSRPRSFVDAVLLQHLLMFRSLAVSQISRLADLFGSRRYGDSARGRAASR
jgi:hypothetical protein